jgi:hypothetical protein
MLIIEIFCFNSSNDEVTIAAAELVGLHAVESSVVVWMGEVVDYVGFSFAKVVPLYASFVVPETSEFLSVTTTAFTGDNLAMLEAPRNDNASLTFTKAGSSSPDEMPIHGRVDTQRHRPMTILITRPSLLWWRPSWVCSRA